MKKILISYFILFSIIVNAQKSGYNFSKIDSIGYALDSTIANGDKTYFNSVFSTRLFISRFLIITADKSLDEFNRGFAIGFSNKFDFGQILLNEVASGTNYDYLRFYLDKDKKFHLVFRLYSDQGLNYHDYLLEDTTEGFKIVDLYVYVTGEHMSETIQAVYKGLLSNEKFGKGLTDGFTQSVMSLKKIRELVADGKYQDAFDEYQKVSKAAKKKKLFKITLIQITKNLSDDKYIEAIEDYRQEFPNDASLNLLLIDTFYLKKKYAECLQSIDALDKALEGDTFLDLFRGNISYSQGDLESAITYFSNITTNYPNFFEGYDSLLTLYIESNKIEKTLNILDIMIDQFSFTKEEIISNMEESFSDFSKNENFINWSKNN